MYVCVWSVSPHVGRPHGSTDKLWHYLEQEHGTLGAKLILSVHIPCKDVCVCCVCVRWLPTAKRIGRQFQEIVPNTHTKMFGSECVCVVVLM